MRVRVLGCGPSSGVPSIGNRWGVCDPENPKNRRRRPSILVESGGTTVLVDTSPDLRDQLLDADIHHIDAVLYTHEHADHVNGIDDLRMVQRLVGHNIEAFAAPSALALITDRYDYLFSGRGDVKGLYRPVIDGYEIDGPFTVGGLDIVPFEQDHGICMTLGFRFGRFAYSTDVVELPEVAFDVLAGIDTWMVDCLRDGEEHPTHANLAKTLGWIDRVRPRRAILTHMNFEADYDRLCAATPNGVEPAYDGMQFEVAD